MSALAQSVRVLNSAVRDIDETEERAVAAWRAVERLSTCPTGCLAMNRQALIEMQERIDQMLARVGGEA